MIANIANYILNHLATLAIVVAMVKVGESKYDNYGRITCSVKIAELLDLEKGEDVVEWHVQGGNVILKKRTRTYQGLDLEGNEIHERLLQYEEDNMDAAAAMEMDPEERLRIAEEEYELEKKKRAERKAKGDNTKV